MPLQDTDVYYVSLGGVGRRVQGGDLSSVTGSGELAVTRGSTSYRLAINNVETTLGENDLLFTTPSGESQTYSVSGALVKDAYFVTAPAGATSVITDVSYDPSASEDEVTCSSSTNFSTFTAGDSLTMVGSDSNQAWYTIRTANITDVQSQTFNGTGDGNYYSLYGSYYLSDAKYNLWPGPGGGTPGAGSAVRLASPNYGNYYSRLYFPTPSTFASIAIALGGIGDTGQPEGGYIIQFEIQYGAGAGTETINFNVEPPYYFIKYEVPNAFNYTDITQILCRIITPASGFGMGISAWFLNGALVEGNPRSTNKDNWPWRAASTRLTFASTQDLKYFYNGQVIRGLTQKMWSGMYNAGATWYIGNGTPAFDGNEGTRAIAASSTTVTWTADNPIQCQGMRIWCNKYSSSTAGFGINGVDRTADLQSSSTQVLNYFNDITVLESFYFSTNSSGYETGSPAKVDVRLNGLWFTLIDSNLSDTNPEAIFCTGIDVSNRYMYVSGGQWGGAIFGDYFSGIDLSNIYAPSNSYDNQEGMFDGHINTVTAIVNTDTLNWTGTINGDASTTLLVRAHNEGNRGYFSVVHGGGTSAFVVPSSTNQEVEAGTVPLTDITAQVSITWPVTGLKATSSASNQAGYISVVVDNNTLVTPTRGQQGTTADTTQFWSQNGDPTTLASNCTWDQMFDNKTEPVGQAGPTYASAYMSTSVDYTLELPVSVSGEIKILASTGTTTFPNNAYIYILDSGGTQLASAEVFNSTNSPEWKDFGTLSDVRKIRFVTGSAQFSGMMIYAMTVDGATLINKGLMGGEAYVQPSPVSGNGLFGSAAGSTMTLTSSNHEWIDNTNRLGENFYALPTTEVLGLQAGLLVTNYGVNLTRAKTFTARSVDGYYPLYRIPLLAAAVGDGTYTTYTLGGITYYMPNGVTQYLGNHVP